MMVEKEVGNLFNLQFFLFWVVICMFGIEGV